MESSSLIIAGARSIQTFGGFNMSGTDSKAGGPDYLLLFTQAKSIAEKIRPRSPGGEKQSARQGAIALEPPARAFFDVIRHHWSSIAD